MKYPPGFRHGLRVRLGGLDGPRGKLYRCEGKHGQYWRVRLVDGTWQWPDGIIVDGPGDRILALCLDCRLQFVGHRGDLICSSCQAAAFGSTSTSTAADSNVHPRRGPYRRRRNHF